MLSVLVVLPVAPLLTQSLESLTFVCHLYVRPVPVAVTLNFAVWPALVVAFTGCFVITGAATTVRVAASEITFAPY